MTFGEWLKQTRKLRGLSQEALADKVGVTHAHISKIETGRNQPHKDLVEEIADALGVERRIALRAFIGETVLDEPGELVRELDPEMQLTMHRYSRLGKNSQELVDMIVETMFAKEHPSDYVGMETQSDSEETNNPVRN